MEASQIAAVVSGAAGLIVGVAAALTTVVRPILRGAKTLRDMREDYFGEPARDGVPARPGVMARLATNEAQGARIEMMLAEHLESHRVALSYAAGIGWPAPPPNGRRRAHEPAPDPDPWRDHP